MEKKDIFLNIQNIKDSNPTIVLGSGASASYGLPTMDILANELKTYLQTKTYHDVSTDRIAKKLIDLLETGIGLEAALADVKVPENIETDIIEVVWEVMHKADSEVYNRFIGGEEMNLKQLFDHIIFGDPAKILNVVSTNYDRIAEYAASQTNAYINLGFTNGLVGKLKEDIMSHPNKPEKDYTGFINILKVHGSLDWYRKDDVIYNCPNSMCVCNGYIPCIVTPGTNKYEHTQQEPHRQLLFAVDNIFKNSQYYICIGYGFNDKHVQEMLLKYAKRRKAKILIVTKDITDSIKHNVIEKEYEYIAVYSDGANGTIFQTPNGLLTIDNEKYWTIEGLMKI